MVYRYIFDSLVIVYIFLLSMGGFPIICFNEVFDYFTTFFTSLYLSRSKDCGDFVSCTSESVVNLWAPDAKLNISTSAAV